MDTMTSISGPCAGPGPLAGCPGPILAPTAKRDTADGPISPTYWARLRGVAGPDYSQYPVARPSCFLAPGTPLALDVGAWGVPAPCATPGDEERIAPALPFLMAPTSPRRPECPVYGLVALDALVAPQNGTRATTQHLVSDVE